MGFSASRPSRHSWSPRLPGGPSGPTSGADPCLPVERTWGPLGVRDLASRSEGLGGFHCPGPLPWSSALVLGITASIQDTGRAPGCC